MLNHYCKSSMGSLDNKLKKFSELKELRKLPSILKKEMEKKDIKEKWDLAYIQREVQKERLRKETVVENFPEWKESMSYQNE